VVAAIDCFGKLHGLTLNDRSIKAPEFMNFMDSCNETNGEVPTTMFLDNLRMHHQKVVKARATEHCIDMRYNAAYSPNFNPIEGLWAYAKNQFNRHMINERNFKDRALLYRLVRESIETVPQTYLRNRVRMSIALMRQKLAV
jgi:hypothetical protein